MRGNKVAIIELKSEVTGTVWKVLGQAQQSIEADDTIILVESMKMEIPVVAEQAGLLHEVLVAEGDPVQEGQVVARLSV